MDKENRNRVGIALMLLAIVLFAGGITFAFFKADVTGTQEKLTVTTGMLALTFSDNNTGITKSQLQLGESTTKEFKIENTGTLPVTTNMLWNNLVNTYTEGSLTYEFKYSTNETGPWTAVPNVNGNIPQSESASDKNLAEDLTIPAHTTYYYQLTITLNHLADVNQTADKTAVLSSNFKLGDKVLEMIPSIVTSILKNETPTKYVKSGNPTFSSVATEDETKDGLYAMADDYGTSYYYRGAVTNNYVKFGKWAAGTTLANGTDASGKDMWWRIIRINGDGSLRMIYDGTVAHKNGGGIGQYNNITGVDGVTTDTNRFIKTNQVWNSNSNDAKYVGWMYGGTNGEASTSKEQAQTNETNSDLKNLINEWYDANLASYDEYIADAVYCNDRSIPSESEFNWGTRLGYAQNTTAYGTSGRLVDTTWEPKANPTPQFTCPQKNDAFTVSDSIYGNAIGTDKSRKIGLITADEVTTAGGMVHGTNKNYYLYKSSRSSYWTLSPVDLSSLREGEIYSVEVNGTLDYLSVHKAPSVAPVISIKAEYATQLTGTGIASNPYIIPGIA